MPHSQLISYLMQINFLPKVHLFSVTTIIYSDQEFSDSLIYPAYLPSTPHFSVSHSTFHLSPGLCHLLPASHYTFMSSILILLGQIFFCPGLISVIQSTANSYSHGLVCYIICSCMPSICILFYCVALSKSLPCVVNLIVIN